MRKQKFIGLLLCMLLLCAAVMTACGSKSADEGGGDKKAITITVTHKDGSQNVKEVETDCETLADAMAEADMLDPSLADGTYYTVVDGEEADTDAEEWWCLTVDGEQAVTGFDETKVEEGKSYEITFTEGW